MNGFSRRLIVGCVCAYAFSVGIAFVSGTRQANSKAEKLLDNAVEMITSTISSGADAILKFVGTAVVRAFESPQDVTPKLVELYKRAMSVDELTFVDGEGRIVYSTETNAIPGSYFNPASKLRLADYSLLITGNVSTVVEPFRGSVENPDLRRKYAGVAFPCGKGFVQIGLDEKRLVNDFDYFYEGVASDWRVGECGYYIVANPATGYIISTLDHANVGRSLNDSGVAPDLLYSNSKSGKTKVLDVFNMPSFVRDEFVCGHRVLSVFPKKEVTGAVHVSMLVTSIVLLVLFVAFGYLVFQIVKRNQQIRMFFEAEKRQVEKDLLMAKSIQEHVLPTVFPPYPHLVERIDIYAEMHPAKEVGGDFYDFMFVGPEQIAFIVADVSGKGVPGAMFMMRAKATLQGLLQGGMDVAEAMAKASDQLCVGNYTSMFVTAWVGVLNIATGNVCYVNAGHNPPLLERENKTLDCLRQLSGPPLAAIEGVKYRKYSFKLNPGEGVLLYTDGVTEANDVSGELYGENRLVQCLESSAFTAGCSSSQIVSDVAGNVRKFTKGTEQADDITLLSFRLLGFADKGTI